MRFALRIAYDGTAFYGFQRQPDVRTVEGELIKALSKLGIIRDAESSNFKGASRTDRGVSAIFNVVAFDVASRPDLVRAEVLNHHLRDLWVLGIAEVPDDFHPRFQARSKTYRYYLVDEGFNERDMGECAALFVGEHDFTAFSRLEPGKDPIRELFRVDVIRRQGYYIIEIEGKSFLWEMARRIVNAVRLCGLGLMEIREVEEMLKGEYNKKVPPAPPEGLILWHMEYPDVKFQADERGIKKAKRDLFERYSRALTRAALFGDALLEL
ncbi:tRNA pseudouridine(38-40) synthase TruA [Thermococcus sp. 18S1]|uniref:tRNA pseudouridine(38-40) synthase TruA n=1 Tax=Thermococcus sp. 18S1 TaxID=1638210 RepID=UPI001439BA3C|nr:tRNA pseudouridine(38-40) synthase TruA [Thermococcus sp. 18S1]NJE30864.1 tRNA pseudouridine(38-40) synthase TruA [Thermococcus sp. 18S1]